MTLDRSEEDEKKERIESLKYEARWLRKRIFRVGRETPTAKALREELLKIELEIEELEPRKT